MAEQWQLRKGSTAENEGFVGAEGELTYDTTTKAIHVHDGETAGGALIDVVVAYQLPTSENGYKWYRKYASGWVEQGGLGVASSTINLPIKMSDANYTLTATCDHTESSHSFPSWIGSRTNTSIIIKTGYGDTQYNYNIMWRVEGMAAQ